MRTRKRPVINFDLLSRPNAFGQTTSVTSSANPVRKGVNLSLRRSRVEVAVLVGGVLEDDSLFDSCSVRTLEPKARGLP
jgi:hypothetical protein